VKRLLLSFLLLFLTFFPGLYSQEFLNAQCYGGKSQLRLFLNSEMHYPEQDLKQGIEGSVVIGFITDDKGKVTEKYILESLSPDIDKEAMRLFSMILWEPAKHYGNPVSSEQTFELKFDVGKYKRIAKKRGRNIIHYTDSEIDSTNSIYDFDKLDVIPEPVFGESDMNLARFISENTHYPESAYKQNIQGTVKLLFVIEQSGNISNCKVIQSVAGGCNEEAKRVIRLINWKPGVKNGKIVRTLVSFGISFGNGSDSKYEYFPAQHGSTMQ
jgi:TonB family protein